jgi:hypothetical protein
MMHAPTNPPQNQALDYLAALAERCGMTDLSPWADAHALVCVGAFDGLAVAVQWSAPGQRTATTRVVARYEGTPFELKLRPELAGESIDKILGMTVDVEVGDKNFDARFVIEAAPPAAARQVLDAAAREALSRIPITDDSPAVVVQNGEISITWRGAPDPVRVEAALQAARAMHTNATNLREGLGESQSHGPFRQGGAIERVVDPFAREAARTRLRKARARVAMVIGTATLTGVGFLATVILGRVIG